MTTTATLKIRFSHIDSHNIPGSFYAEGSEWNTLIERWANQIAGQTFYVTTSQRPRADHATYHLANVPGRTNLSHEPRIEGWLGTTDNVDRYARGQFVVIGHSSTHLHLRKIESSENAA